MSGHNHPGAPAPRPERRRFAVSTVVVGVPTEIKDNEKRVALTPDGVVELVHHGHEVIVQAGAGEGSRFSDEEYAAAGAKIVPTADGVFDAADLIVKVKEPVPPEYDRFRPGQQLFTYLHLAADRGLTEFLLERRINSIAYETVQTADGKLPLLTPMSEVAGRMAVQAAAHHLESPAGGAGILLGGVPGTPAAQVLIIGGGVSGTEAAKIALGMRAIVRVLDTNPSRLAYLSDIFGGRLDLVMPNRARTAAYVAEADVVIGAVLVPGAKAPKLVTRDMIAAMRPGSVVVDIAIDQGGCFETSRPTTHSEPTYIEEGVTHYCVANIPGAVARTSTLALTSSTLPYLIRVARHGISGAAQADPALRHGLSTLDGQLVSRPVAEAHKLPFTDPAEALAQVPQ
jgi:alanine dehydrogenase